jgi:sugar lactone lactonase YvrE
MDAEGSIWYADVPNRRCARVREGGEVLETIDLDRGGFACMLGGADGTTLFIVAAEWHGFDRMADASKTGLVLSARAPSPSAGYPASR